MVGMLVLIGVLALASTVIYSILVKKKIDAESFIFYSSAIWFVLSAIKSYVGDYHISLFQSFWDVVPMTYIHYGIVLVPFSIIAPILYKLIFKEKGELLIKWFSAISIIAFFIAGIFTNGIPVGLFVVMYILILMVSWICAFVLKKELAVGHDNTVISTIKSYFWCALLFGFYILLYLPNELYFLNASEFSNSYWSFLLILFGVTICCTLGILLLISILPEKWRDIFSLLIFSITICEYIQGMVLNGKLNALTGELQKWDDSVVIINLLIWTTIIIAAFILNARVKSFIRITNYISIFIIITLSITAVTLALQNTTNMSSKSDELTNIGALEISSEQNVIVFVLDCFDTRVMEELIDNSPEFVEPLSDFVYYNNVASRFPRTIMAIPFLLTGSEWNINSDEAFLSYAYTDESFISKLYHNDIQLGLYTNIGYVDDSYYYMVSNYESDVSRKSDIANTCKVMFTTSMYKTLPFFFKNNYFYYSSDITDMVAADKVWNIDNDIPFYNMIKSSGLSVSESDKKMFKFYHMRGDHWPFYLSADVKVDNTHREVTAISQAKGCLNIVYDYISELKRLGQYDNTTIIITSDHGNVMGYNSATGGVTDACIPIMFVKLAHQSGDSLIIDSKPVSQVDLFATILDEYGLPHDEYEYKLDDDIDENRERYFYNEESYRLKVGVVGDAHDINNWKVIDYVEN